MINLGIPWEYQLLSLLKPDFSLLCSMNIFSESTVNCRTLPISIGKGYKNECFLL